jgi:hypothetical protein
MKVRGLVQRHGDQDPRLGLVSTRRGLWQRRNVFLRLESTKLEEKPAGPIEKDVPLGQA